MMHIDTMWTFLTEFLLFFAIAAPLYSLLQWGRRQSLGGNAVVFTGPRRLKELSGFPREEQKRLLHAADSEAFRGWHVLVPTLLEAAIFARAVAMTQALPYSIWISSGLALVAMMVCFWIAARVEARLLKPYLRSQIELMHLAEPSAAPNAGPVTPLGNSGVQTGPPSGS
jgi:hypothetical protein